MTLLSDITVAMRWLRPAAWVATAVYWVAIFVATHLPPEKLAKVPRVPDKVAHFLIFFGLAAVLGTAMLSTFPTRRAVPLWVLVISLVYGAVDEVLQPLVRRQASVRDWFADGLGIVPAVLLLAVVQHILLNRARTARQDPSDPPCNSSSLPTTSQL
jgi:VanZ family protein